NPDVTDRGYLNVNRVCGRDDVQGVVGSEFAHATMKAKSVYVIHDKTQYGQGVAEFFKTDAEKKGIKVLGFEGTEEKSNFDPIITPIKAKNPDVIYFGGIYDQAAPFFKQAREKGVRSKFLGPDGMDSSDLTKIAGKAVVGMDYTSAAGPASVLPKAKAFVEEFKKKFGKNPEPYAAEAYDAATVALKAVDAAVKGGKVTLLNASPCRRVDPLRPRFMDYPLLLGIFPQVLLDGIILGFMYALIALGYTMVYGVLEFINFAHSEIFIVGAFVGVEILL